MTSAPVISDLLLERFALGELSPSQTAEIRAALEHDPALRARLAAIEASNREILQAHPPERVLAEVRRRAAWSARTEGKAPAKRWVLALGVPSMAAAALAALALVSSSDLPSASLVEQAVEATRTKGLRPHLVVYRVQAGKPQRIEPGAAVRAGDALQLAYVSTGSRFGVVLSLDGRGAVTLHLPEKGEEAVPLQPGSEAALPSGYELDDAPDFERFVLVTAPARFEVSAALAAARALAGRPDARTRPLELPEGLEQASFLVQKAQP